MDVLSQPSFIAHHTAQSPLGQISLAGLVHDGLGVPRHPLRVLGSYAIVYLLDGSGTYRDATGLRLNLTAGDLLIVFPEIPHTYGPRHGQTWAELFLVFDGPVFDLWRESGLIQPAQPLWHLTPIDYWSNQFESILAAARQPGYAPSVVEVCRLQLTLAEALIAGATGRTQGEEMAWVSRACALLDAELGQALDLRQVAQKLDMSYDGFRKRFQRQVKMPPARYRGLKQIDRACELMQQGVLTDKQIAEHLGFCDEFYFSRRFKQVTGRSPRAWRASLPRMR